MSPPNHKTDTHVRILARAALHHPERPTRQLHHNNHADGYRYPILCFHATRSQHRHQVGSLHIPPHTKIATLTTPAGPEPSHRAATNPREITPSFAAVGTAEDLPRLFTMRITAPSRPLRIELPSCNAAHTPTTAPVPSRCCGQLRIELSSRTFRDCTAFRNRRMVIIPPCPRLTNHGDHSHMLASPQYLGTATPHSALL